MARALMMSKEQIAGLVEIARLDPALWAALKDREQNQLNEDGSAKIPSLSMLVEDFVRQQYGRDHIYATGSLIIQLRLNTRQELGLPV